MARLSKPDPSEYGEYFAGYVNKVDSNDIVDFLRDQLQRFQSTMQTVDEAAASRIDPPYQWTLKQVVGHLIDGEKVFGYRIHCFGCGDQTELPGFEHTPYVDHLDYEGVLLSDLIEEFAALRQANLHFLNRLRDEDWGNRGRASGCDFTVRGKAYVLGGHVQHHFEIMQQRISA